MMSLSIIGYKIQILFLIKIVYPLFAVLYQNGVSPETFIRLSHNFNVIPFTGVLPQRSDFQPLGVTPDILSDSRWYVQQVPFDTRQDIGRRTWRDARRKY